ncbi:MAG: hypothetical protein NTU60_07455 [Candidatus Aminicenantes bacterium]|nr:hypothetical protein [Candidatus Aminicenantes bacterium]
MPRKKAKSTEWRQWGDHPWFVALCALAAVAAVVVAFVQLTGNHSSPGAGPPASTADGPRYELRFFLLQDRQVRSSQAGERAIEVDFRLTNSTSPPEEVHNVFGQLWIDGKHLLASTIPPARGHAGAGRVEWDIQIPVFPKEGVFIPPKILVGMPSPEGEILLGAQFVSKETQRQEHLWRIVNDGGAPKIVTVKSPHDFK